jgi:hypothetical protein
MKKKLFSVFAAVLVLVICIAALVACNPYKADSIGSGDSSAAVESNGGYVVKQGRFIYFINGYVGESADNAWGAATKQGIVRAEIKDGKVDPTSAKLVVPKSVYNSSTAGGIAIHGEWIYYTSVNTDKDKTGTASTVNTDFMRTKTDGSVTQLIGTIGTRSAKYLFTTSRVLYYTDNTIGYIDFSGMNDKATDKGKGAVKGTLAENVENVVWDYATDSIFYVQTAPSEDSYKNYNNLCTIKADGSGQKVLATQTTFVAEGVDPVNDQLNVFKYNILNLYVESDGDCTLYYTKSHTFSSNSVPDGLFMAKASNVKGTEKNLNTIASTTLVPLGYAEGALAYNAHSVYCWYNGVEKENPVQVTTTSQTIWKVDKAKGVVYYTASSSAKSISKISYREAKDNAAVIMEEGIKTDWLVLDFVGNDFYFFASDDDNYLHTVNLETFDKDAEDAASTYIGCPTDRLDKKDA